MSFQSKYCIRNLKFRTHVHDEVYFRYRSGATLKSPQNHPSGDETSPKSFFDQNIAKLSVNMKNVDKKLYRV